VKQSTVAAAEVTYRRAQEADLPRVFAVFRAALNAYLVPAGQTPVPEEDDQSPAYRHFLRHDADRFWVAEAEIEQAAAGDDTRAGDAVGRGIVAWSSGLLRGDWWFLSSLFVLPAAQGRGVGARLFELAGTGAPAGAVRATMTDSIQPVSNTLYARRGLLPREVLVEIGGRPRTGLEPPRLGSLEPEALTTASIPDLREIDAAASGIDRSVDHDYYLRASGRRGWLFRRAGRPVAYVMVRPDGWVGPAASVRAPDIGTVAAFALAALAGEGAEKVHAGVPARCESVQRAFWEAGLAYQSTPGLLLASRPFGRLDRYVPASYGLF
jgi:GNAT superfamily N-acetyltransferase